MKLTKYAQSCFLLQDENTKILIDPGFIQINDNTLGEWKNPDYILVTHKHADHFSEENVQKIISPKTKIYATKETSLTYPNTKFEIVKEGEEFKLGKANVKAVKAVHGYNPLLKEGKIVNAGVGYIIELNGKNIYHTSDTICFENNYKTDIILLPFNNHGVVMGPYEAALFAKETGAILVIPMHQDNSFYPGDIQKLQEELVKNDLNYKILKVGESIEI